MFRISLKKASAVTAIGVLSAIGLLAGTSGAAEASNSVTIAPLPNPFVFMDVVGASTGDGARVIVWLQSGDNQRWSFRPAGSSYEIVNQHSGKCLTTDGVAGHQLYQWRCKGDPGQFWDTELPTHGGAWPIRNPASGLQVDLNGHDTTAGTPVIGWPWNGGSNQYWITAGV
jgi:hypothetical protein